MTDKQISDDVAEISSNAGWVDIDCILGVHMSLTPLAAAKTGAALVEKAAEAIGKKAMNDDARMRDLRLPYPEM